MYILLGNGLGNKKNIGVDFNRLFDEFLVGNLCAHVDSFDHVVAFKSVMACKALAVHDCIDSDGVRIGAGGSADHDDLPAEMLANIFVGFCHAHGFLFNGLHMDVLIVNGMHNAAVNNIECELLVQRLCKRNVGFFNAHFADELACSFHALFIVLNGKGEAELNLAVVHGVAVCLEPCKVESCVKISLVGVIKSAAHYSLPPFLCISSTKGLK